jgi:hypothetical protein
VPLLLAPQTTLSKNIDSFAFSLGDVSRHCEAVRIGDDISLECTGAALRVVEQLCDIEMRDEDQGYIDCQGNSLRQIEFNCSVEMYDENVGDLLC